MVLHELALFSGVGMLSEGLRAGLAYLGIKTRTVCHIEREGYAASVLVARMQEGSLDEAPIWSDVCTFDAKRWAGSVDIVVGGFPCTDLSLAGKRAGLDGARSGLFFEIPRIADACSARFLFLENVAGIASATASVVDEAEGALEERAAARVLGELADRGWNAEWLTLSASEVGASHGRARWFCFAWRNMDNAGRVQRCTGHEQDRPGVAEACGHQAHNRAADRGAELGNAASARRQERGQCGQRELSAQVEAGLHHRLEQPSAQLADAERISGKRWGIAGNVARAGGITGGKARKREWCGTAYDCGSGAMADPSSTRPQGAELGAARNSHRGGAGSTWTN